METEKGTETQVGVRMSLKERELLERAATRSDRKLSAWIRLAAVDRARSEIAGTAAPVRQPDPAETATLAALHLIEGADPYLPGALLDLGEAAIHRPPLARALRELAASFLPDGRAGTAERSRRERRTGKV